MKFLVDRMCGRLAGWLRLLGYDTAFVRDGAEPPEIIYTSLKERRIILTRNTAISPGKAYGVYFVKGNDFRSQIKEVIPHFGLSAGGKEVFSRCVSCNGQIKSVEKKLVKGRVPSFVFQTHEEFYSCASCGKIFWKGSHMALAKELLDKL